MKSGTQHTTYEKVSFFQILRIVFVLFSLYLLRDAFFRWDGFKYYASFSEYIPAVSLVLVLWTITAFVISIPTWILLRISETFFSLIRLKVRAEHILLCGVISVLVGIIAWKIKRFLWTDIQTTKVLKSVVLLGVGFLSVYLTWILRKKAEHWFKTLLERITPLIWLFFILVLISISVVAVSTFGTKSYKPIPKAFPHSSYDAGEMPPNIVLVIFDTMTAEDMSVYGYERNTTPFISKWADKATVFKRTEASNNHTTPATSSIMTGKRVWTHQVYHQSGSVPVNVANESLPGELKKSGYFNVAFVVNPSASARTLGIFDNFDISPLMTDFMEPENMVFFDFTWGNIATSLYKIFGDKIRLYNWILDTRLLGKLEPFVMPRYKLMDPAFTKTAMPPEVAFNKFLEIYDDLPQPFFAWIHIYPPHAPYLPPAQYRGMFGPELPHERYKSFTDDIDSRDMHDMRILYDEFIRYCDTEFEDFVNQLEKRSKQKNTAMIITSDHGESFQHGIFQHAVPALYEQLTHVPLIIKEPGQVNGKTVSDIVEQIDIPATILDLAHTPVPQWMEGRSLVPMMHGDELPPRPAFSMYFEQNPSRGHQITKGLVAVWEGDYKLIHYLEEEKSLLFDLKQDPEEMNNLFDRETEPGKYMLNLIRTGLDNANEKIRLSNLVQ